MATPPNVWPRGSEDPFSPGGSFDWRRYWALLLRFKWVIVLVTLLGTVAGVIGTRFLEPKYEARATILIEATRGAQPGQGPIQPTELFQSYSWIELLRSYLVLDSVTVAMQLYLTADSTARPALSDFKVKPRYALGDYRYSVSADGESFTLSTDDGRVLQNGVFGDSVGQDLGFLWSPGPEDVARGRTLEFRVGNVRDAANQLARDLEAQLDRNGNFMRLAYTAGDPEGVAGVLNAVADRFAEVAAGLRREKLDTLAAILEEQRSYAEERLRRAEEEYERFRVQTATLPTQRGLPVSPFLDETRDPAFATYWDLKFEQEEIRNDRDVLDRALAQAADSGLAVVALEDVASRHSAALEAALSDLSEKRADLRVLQASYYDDHPAVVRAREEVRDLDVRVIPDLVRSLIEELANREAELEARIVSAGGELVGIPPRAIQEEALQGRVEIAESFYNDLQVRHEAALLAAANNIPDVRVLDWAIAPEKPVNSKDVPRFILLAFLASLGLGVGAAIMLDRIDPRVKSPEELGRLGLRILGTVPHVNTGHPADSLGNVAEVVEAFRLIRLNVTHAHGTAGPIVLAVTSPTGSEGKSFVSSNLGLAFSFLGLRTLVIDADVRRGRVHRLLGGNRRPGLTDYLGGAAALEQVVQPTQYPALYRIASGSRRQDGPELLQSAAMASLVADLRSSYDVLIIDTPPIGVGADALALATLARNLIVVVRTGSTNRELTETKLDFIFRLPVRLLGAILNDVPARGAYGYYGSAYYSSYLPGYESKDEGEFGNSSGG